jgi:hypothetical protein
VSSPLGPLRAVLGDPFCRYEARRYWTWRRYAWLCLALVVWVELLWTWLVLGTNLFGGYVDEEEAVALLVLLHLLGRAPLSFEASTGAALCIAPEKSSGQIEQFVLTPVDPWRFCLARMAGRLRGLTSAIRNRSFFSSWCPSFTSTWPPCSWSTPRRACASRRPPRARRRRSSRPT